MIHKVKGKRNFCLKDYRHMVLKQSEEQFRFLAENIRDVIFRLKLVPVRALEYINPAVNRLAGYTPDELYQDMNLIYKIIHPDDHNLIEKLFNAGVNSDTTGIVRWVAKDGSTLWFEYSYTYITDETGNVVAVEGIGRDITERVKIEKQLTESKRQLNNILESITDGCVAVDNNWRVTFINRKAEKIVQKVRNEILGRVLWDVFPRIVTSPLYMLLHNAMSQQIYLEVTDYYPPLNKWVEMHIYPSQNGLSIFFRDITGVKKIEKELQKTETRYKEFVDSLPQIVFEIDLNGNLTYTNRNSFTAFGYTVEDFNRGLNVLEVLVPEDREKAVQNFKSLTGGAISTGNEYTLMRKNGTTFPGIVHSKVIIDDCEITGFRGFIIDITERKKNEEALASERKKLKYLSFHDALTGLHNRAYFEYFIKNERVIQPVALLVCDIDGLKIVNDAMGHDVGDKQLKAAADILRNTLRQVDNVFRIGGDEFAAILPQCDERAVEKICERLRSAIAEFNLRNPMLSLSMSIGFATASDHNENIDQLFKEADNNMYREKLHRSRSVRSSIVQTLTKAMEARDYITEGHADRMQDLVEGLATFTGMPERSLTDLRLLARFHDIGKVGVPDRILFKPGPLTLEEKNEMQRHSEIGHRISLSAPDLMPIADWILKHHEWWDGNGYPLGLKGEEIPLECRVLAIVDAYDAMTSDRPYRKALPKEAALDELKRCAGMQFDPGLVSKFIDYISRFKN